MSRPISEHRIPVILDIDIGTDIDDTWALALMLKSPELDVRLVVTETADTRYRARVAAKMLEAGGRTDVPVGIGIPIPEDRHPTPQAPWVEGYDLARYPGPVYEDGVGALIDTIMDSTEPVTLVCIGPLPNIGRALERGETSTLVRASPGAPALWACTAASAVGTGAVPRSRASGTWSTTTGTAKRSLPLPGT